ncbi:hypothetical protein GCM10009798_21030 [Nocardioides panacihumi]|uniref:DUF4190 domain-containing protein n=1 Tax=Nocardioides panacihumi TaxID=400774 RepID=A0ABN2QZN8_9ACTN
MSYGTPPPPPPPGYGAPMYGAPPANHKRAVLILVLGILSIPCCGLFTGIPAIIMGRKALAEIDGSGGTVGGRGLVQGGYICGIVGTALSVLGIIVQIIIAANR